MVIQSDENPMMLQMGKSNGFRTVIGDCVSFKSYQSFLILIWFILGHGKRNQTVFSNQNPLGLSHENWSLQTNSSSK